ncbi:MAG: penicillin-binding transpeptidase domain-containing protein [bacterium]
MGTRFGPAADIDMPVLRVYIALIVVAFAVILGKLFSMQILTAREHKVRSLKNIIVTVDINPPRGDILDRGGNVLATDENVFALLYIAPLSITKQQLTDDELDLLERLGLARLASLRDLRASEYRRLREAGFQDLSGFSEEQRKSLGWILKLPAADIALLQNFIVKRNVRGTVTSWENPGNYHDLMRVASYLQGVEFRDMVTALKSGMKRVNRYQPVRVVNELDRNQVIFIAENNHEFQGFYVEEFAYSRKYPLGLATPHLLGYLGFFSEENDPEWIRRMGFGDNEYVGKDGIERQYEGLLHGIPGRRDIEVDNRMAFQRIVQDVAPTKGTDVYLAINKNLQMECYKAMQGRPGSFIVTALSEGHEGEVLAYVSSPGYDPGRFKEKGYYQSLLDNPYKPLINRASGLAYPPGSTFKLVTASAALQKGGFSPGSGFYCPGYKQIGTYKMRCHEDVGHGGVTLLEGISKSCDVVFYDIVLAMDNDSNVLHDYAERFGYGSRTGLDLPEDARGTVPNRSWKEKAFDWANPVDRGWYDGDKANFAIGQGFMNATALQVLQSATVVANRGKLYEPHLLVATRQDLQVRQERIKPPRDMALETKTLEIVEQGMRLAVTEGTCRSFNNGETKALKVAAKTGTAEAGRGKADHSWVVGYFPVDNPKYAFVAFFQNGGSSGAAAVPAAKKVLTWMVANDPIPE